MADVDLEKSFLVTVCESIFPGEALVSRHSADFRHDGRSFSDQRSVSVEVNLVDDRLVGSSLVNLGGTVVSCTVKPFIELNTRPTSLIDVELDNISMTPFPIPTDNNRHAEDDRQGEAWRIEHVLRTTLQTSVVQEDLEILRGKAFWKLTISLVCVCNNGNLMDASMLACSAALKNTRLHRVEWIPNPDFVKDNRKDYPIQRISHVPKIVVKSTEHSRPLKLRWDVVSVSFLVVDGIYTVDPTRREELSHRKHFGYLTLCINANKRMVFVANHNTNSDCNQTIEQYQAILEQAVQRHAQNYLGKLQEIH